jgi:hypothetical protein
LGHLSACTRTLTSIKEPEGHPTMKFSPSPLPSQAVLEPSLTVFSPRVRVVVTTTSFLGFELEPPCRVTHGSEAPMVCPWRLYEQRAQHHSFSLESLTSSNRTQTVTIRSWDNPSVFKIPAVDLDFDGLNLM